MNRASSPEMPRNFREPNRGINVINAGIHTLTIQISGKSELNNQKSFKYNTAKIGDNAVTILAMIRVVIKAEAEPAPADLTIPGVTVGGGPNMSSDSELEETRSSVSRFPHVIQKIAPSRRLVPQAGQK